MSDLSNHIFSESTIHRRFEMTKTMTNTQIHKLEVLESMGVKDIKYYIPM